MRKSFSPVKSPQQDLRDSTDLIIDTIHSAGTNNVIDAMYNARNISWTCFSSDPNDDKTRYNITIIAGENNNDNTYQCGVDNYATKKAKLLVVNGTNL